MMKPKEEANVITKDLNSELQNSLIEGAKIHENSLILITSKNQIYYIEDLNECKLELICNSYKEERSLNTSIIQEIIVIDPSFSGSGKIEVIFPNEEGGIFRVYQNNVQLLDALGSEKPFTLGKIVKMAMTPLNAGKKGSVFLAFYNEEEEMIISSSNLDSEQNMKFKVDEPKPEALVWCGADTAALVYNEMVALVGPNKAKAEFQIESSKGFFCLGEVDGMRILSNHQCHFIEKVPTETELAFTTASMDPSAHIINAYQKYLSNDPRAEETLKNIKEDNKSSLAEGIKSLIKAATCEFEPENQKYLLRASSFAKNFIAPGEFNAEEFVKTLKDLRIVNQLHVHKVNLSYI